MTGIPWAVCDRRNAHGQHEWVTGTTLGEQREHVCPGVVSDRPLPMARFFRALLTGAEPGRHRGKAVYPEPAVVGPGRHCAVVTEPHPCCEDTCTEEHGSETSRIERGAAS